MKISPGTTLGTVIAAAALWLLVPSVPWGCFFFPVLVVSFGVVYAFRRVDPRVRTVLGVLVLLFFPLQCSKGLWEYHQASRPFYRLGGHVQASGDGMSMVAGTEGVNYVSLAGSSVTDADLQRLHDHLSRLHAIRSLSLSNTDITDTGLQYLTGLRHTSYLELDGTWVTIAGWRQLQKALPRTAVYLQNDFFQTWGAAVSPAGRTVALAECGLSRYPDGSQTSAGRVIVSDIETNNEVRMFQAGEDLVTSVAFSPDGRRIAAGSYDRTVTIHALELNEAPLRFEGRAAVVLRLVFSPDGARLAACYGHWDESRWRYTSGAVVVWDVSTGEVLDSLEGFADRVNSAVFSPDGRSLVTASSDHSMRLWDIETGEQIRTFVGHTGPVYGAAFSPDGSRLVSGSGDRSTRLWSTATGDELLKMADNGEVAAVLTFSADGKMIAAGSYRPYRPESLGSSVQGIVTVWLADTRMTVRILQANYPTRVLALNFSPDVQNITAVLGGGRLITWDLLTGKELRRQRIGPTQ